jgi:hypothetical protein
MQRILNLKGIEVFNILPLAHPLMRTFAEPLRFPLRDEEFDIIDLMQGISRIATE